MEEIRISIHFDSEKNLFVWFDQKDCCYCNLVELCVIFNLFCRKLNKKISQSALNDFVETAIRLKDFVMILNDKQIEYYSYK